tara:strand:+ start:1189 stop:1551 length:363 start_codon:yes stop_codon:yes gene_type:complete
MYSKKKDNKKFKPHKMYKGKMVKDARTMADHLRLKKLGYGHTKPKASKSKMETIELDGKKVKFKEGALRKMLKLKPDEKLTIPMIKKIINKNEFTLFKRRYKMTPLMKKRLNFAMTLMKK